MIFDSPLPDAPVDQGDIIDGCPLHHLESIDLSTLLAEREPGSIVSTYSQVLVLTQTCYLAQKKSSAVLVAVIPDAADMVRQGILKAIDVQAPGVNSTAVSRAFGPTFRRDLRSNRTATTVRDKAAIADAATPIASSMAFRARHSS